MNKILIIFLVFFLELAIKPKNGFGLAPKSQFLWVQKMRNCKIEGINMKKIFKKIEIIELLELEFVIDKPDVFSLIMPGVDSYYVQYCLGDFVKYHQGLMLSGVEDCSVVTCACFFSDYVVDRAIELDSKFLIVKHPLEWVEFPGKFISVSKESYQKCLDLGISVYVLHSSFDAHSIFSPSVKLAEALGFKIEGKLKRQEDLFGVISSLDFSFDETYTSFKDRLRLNGIQTLFSTSRCHRVAVVSGGGDAVESLMIAVEQKCDTYITGIVYCEGNEYSKIYNPKFIEMAKKLKINLFGGSHYATEKYGLIAFSDYLNKLGIKSFFIEEEPKLKELIEFWGRNI